MISQSDVLLLIASLLFADDAMVLRRKMVDCSLRLGGELLPQAKRLKYFWVLFMSGGQMEGEVDRKVWTVVVKRELSQKEKLSIYQSIYVPTLTYGHELWVVTKRADTSDQNELPHGLSLSERLRSGKGSLLGCLLGTSLGRCIIRPSGRRLRSSLQLYCSLLWFSP